MSKAFSLAWWNVELVKDDPQVLDVSSQDSSTEGPLLVSWRPEYEEDDVASKGPIQRLT